MRSSGAGVLSVSILYPKTIQDAEHALSRYGTIFSRANIKTDTETKYARFTWSGISKQSERVIRGLHGRRAIAAINDAVQETTSDIMEYVRDRQAKLALRTVRNLIKQ